MERETSQFHAERSREGVPVRYSHRLGEDQWEYNAWLLDQVSSAEPGLPEWRPQMHKAGQGNIKERPDSYRDSFPDHALVATAEADGKAMLRAKFPDAQAAY